MNAALLALVALVPLARPLAVQDDSEADGNKLIALELLAERNPIQPGSTVTLALRCKIERRWHTYWGENSGDAGIPFKAELKGPSGYEIGSWRFPWPKRHVAEGDIVEYVHEGEMTCLVDVKVPATAKAGDKAQFDLSAKWLVCTDVCVAGAGKTSLTLPVAEQATPANEALFTAARAKEPRPWSEIGRAAANWSGDEAAPKLTIVVPGATAAEYFPYRSSTTKLAGRKVDIGKQGGTVALEFEFEKKNDGDVPDARGVLWVKTDKGETSFLFDKPYRK
jgi:thiol:disulfide interchange protein DsbD